MTQSSKEGATMLIPGGGFTFHFEDRVLGHLFAISLHLLLDPLLVVLLRRTDHHSFALEAGEQAHLPLLARSRHISLQHKHTSALQREPFLLMF